MVLNIPIEKNIMEEARKLSIERLKAYEWIGESKYASNTERSNIIGSLGEIGFHQILLKNKVLNTEAIYKDFTGKDKGDLKIGNLYFEVKTRTKRDWRVYQNGTQLKQILKYKKQNLNMIYVWISIKPTSNVIILEGWNYMNELTTKFMDGKHPSATCNIIRDPKELIKLCYQQGLKLGKKEDVYCNKTKKRVRRKKIYKIQHS